MKISCPEKSRAGFTLLEMIGVLAVMAILASMTVPSVLQSMASAAVQAEAKTLQAVGAQVQRYTSNNATPLNSINWAAQLVGYTDLNSNDLLNNKRGRGRIYLTDNTTNRAMILSVVSTNAALALPANLNSANFQLVWDTPDNAIPTTLSWAGWSAWNNVRNSHQFLVIQRINLSSELQTYRLVFNNTGGGSPQYEVVPLGGSAGTRTPVTPGAFADVRAKQRVNLYTSPSSGVSFTYVVSNTPKTFVFDGTAWSAQ